MISYLISFPLTMGEGWDGGGHRGSFPPHLNPPPPWGEEVIFFDSIGVLHCLAEGVLIPTVMMFTLFMMFLELMVPAKFMIVAVVRISVIEVVVIGITVITVIIYRTTRQYQPDE
jgi:hypothetical protein